MAWEIITEDGKEYLVVKDSVSNKWRIKTTLFLHREKGPAVEYVNGNTEYWYEGKMICRNSQEEFERYLKLKTFW